MASKWSTNLIEYTYLRTIHYCRNWCFVFLPTLFLLAACSTPSSPQVQLIGNQELIELQASGNLQLVDVRTPEEIAHGIIEGAENIDFRNKNFNERIARLDKDQPIAVYCAAGGRSGKASEILLSMGFKEIYDLTGGFSQWQLEEYPISNPE